jgi:large subunit ribosomal protein L17
MKHQRSGRQFGRIRKQRKALINMLLSGLILNEKMKTTEAKAKETKMLIDRIINKAKKATGEKKVAVLRDLRKDVNARALKKLSGEFIKQFSNRKSGYARISKLGRRLSDGAEMAIIEFVK